jgi:hypothetical protein
MSVLNRSATFSEMYWETLRMLSCGKARCCAKAAEAMKHEEIKKRYLPACFMNDCIILVQIKEMYRAVALLSFFMFFFSLVQGQEIPFKLKRGMTFYLPDEVKETSGLVYLDGELYTHNDSGGMPEIYVLDTLGGPVKRSIFIRGAENNDWEALSYYNQRFYIGDFGNNAGSRKNLLVYRVPFHPGKDTLDVEQRIRFYFPDQTDFSAQGKNHAFDTEAMAVYNDSIFLYSKSWNDGVCRIRAIPDSEGDHAAPVVNTFDGNGLITDVFFDETGKRLLFTGYQLRTAVLKPFLLSIQADHPAKPLIDSAVRWNLSPDFVQTEAITRLPSGRLAITAEAIAEKWLDIAPALYLFFLPQ